MTGVSLGGCGPAVPDAVTPEGRALARAELALPALAPPPWSSSNCLPPAMNQGGSDPPGSASGSAHHITGCQYRRLPHGDRAQYARSPISGSTAEVTVVRRLVVGL